MFLLQTPHNKENNKTLSLFLCARDEFCSKLALISRWSMWPQRVLWQGEQTFAFHEWLELFQNYHHLLKALFSPLPEKCPIQPQHSICKQTRILMTVRKVLPGEIISFIRSTIQLNKIDRLSAQKPFFGCKTLSRLTTKNCGQKLKKRYMHQISMLLYKGSLMGRGSLWHIYTNLNNAGHELTSAFHNSSLIQTQELASFHLWNRPQQGRCHTT